MAIPYRPELESFFKQSDIYRMVSSDRIVEVDALIAGETYDDIASKKGLTRERIRQRLAKEMWQIKGRMKRASIARDTGGGSNL